MRGLKPLFFLVGSGRCGTTLLQSLLDAHPDIAICNEARVVEALRFIVDFASLPAYVEREFPFVQAARLHGWVGATYSDAFANAVREHSVSILKRFFELQFPGSKARIYGDKLTWDTSTLGLLDILPDTKYLLLSRDPRDVYCSWTAYARTQHATGHNPLLKPPTLERFAHDWCNYYRAALLHPVNKFHIRYPDLLIERRATLESVMHFLGLPLASEQTAEIDQSTLFAAHGTSTSPEATLGRWRHELSVHDRHYIDSVCADVMIELGYAPGP